MAHPVKQSAQSSEAKHPLQDEVPLKSVHQWTKLGLMVARIHVFASLPDPVDERRLRLTST